MKQKDPERYTRGPSAISPSVLAQEKAIKIIESCNTFAQLRTARRYTNLVRKMSGASAVQHLYDMLSIKERTL